MRQRWFAAYDGGRQRGRLYSYHYGDGSACGRFECGYREYIVYVDGRLERLRVLGSERREAGRDW